MSRGLSGHEPTTDRRSWERARVRSSVPRRAAPRAPSGSGRRPASGAPRSHPRSARRPGPGNRAVGGRRRYHGRTIRPQGDLRVRSRRHRGRRSTPRVPDGRRAASASPVSITSTGVLPARSGGSGPTLDGWAIPPHPRIPPHPPASPRTTMRTTGCGGSTSGHRPCSGVPPTSERKVPAAPDVDPGRARVPVAVGDHGHVCHGHTARVVDLPGHQRRPVRTAPRTCTIHGDGAAATCVDRPGRRHAG